VSLGKVWKTAETFQFSDLVRRAWDHLGHLLNKAQTKLFTYNGQI
jgi:hypothetical protein